MKKKSCCHLTSMSRARFIISRRCTHPRFLILDAHVSAALIARLYKIPSPFFSEPTFTQDLHASRGGDHPEIRMQCPRQRPSARQTYAIRSVSNQVSTHFRLRPRQGSHYDTHMIPQLRNFDMIYIGIIGFSATRATNLDFRE